MELCLCDITFQAMILVNVDLNIFQSLILHDEISAMKYINHHSLRNFNNE